jgi:hypothetical protein
MQLNDEMLKLPISFLPHANWALNLKTDRLPLEFGAWISVLSDLCAFLRGYLHLPRFDSFDADDPLPFMLVPMSRPLLNFHQHTMDLLSNSEMVLLDGIVTWILSVFLDPLQSSTYTTTQLPPYSDLDTVCRQRLQMKLHAQINHVIMHPRQKQNE